MNNNTGVRWVILFMAILLSEFVNAQGCSDAGFCSIDSFQPKDGNAISLRANNQVKAGISYGIADHSISVIANLIEYKRYFGENYSVDAKITSIAQMGNNISTFGISDLFLIANHSLAKSTIVSLGVKVPFSDGGKTHNGLPLPMHYQPGLGTFDLIAGIGFEVKKLQLVFAMQQPITQNNNEFISENYPVGSELRDFQSTNQFQRSGDVLLRLSYPVFLSDNLTLIPGILTIYHLTNDKYTALSGIETEIPGSAGLTVNANIFFDYAISASSALQFSLAMPFIARESRPDGLTRALLATLEYRVRF